MVEGRLTKIAKQLALLEQPFIKDNAKTVGEHIKEAVAAIGENIQVRFRSLAVPPVLVCVAAARGFDMATRVQVRRFSRYNLGEGLEKKSNDFAAEVAAQTGQA